jgi:putative nucleotidyltransferase with HDIG domain
MEFSKKVYAYIAVMAVFAILLTGYIASTSFYAFPPQFSFSNNIFTVLFVVLFWSVLAIVSESFTIVLPNGIGVSVSFAIYLASIIIGGPLLAIIAAAASYILSVVRTETGFSHIFNIPYYKSIFNISTFVLSSGISGLVFSFFSNHHYGQFLFAPTILTVIVYLIINSAIMSKLVSLINNKPFFITWTSNFKGVSLSIFAVGMIGIILALAFISYGPTAVVLFFAPLLLARYSFKLYLNMKHTYIDTISAFNKFLEAKDMYTSGHAGRVLKYSELIASAVHLRADRIENLKNAAILHDIGKIGIDDNILKKTTSLSPDEYRSIKDHVIIGAEIIDGIDFLKGISKIVAQHHERPDGLGYPNGLKGKEICLEASILSIADVYDAMISDRPYRKGLSLEVAMDELRKFSGTQFDPELAEAFLGILEEERLEQERLKEHVLEQYSKEQEKLAHLDAQVDLNIVAKEDVC